MMRKDQDRDAQLTHSVNPHTLEPRSPFCPDSMSITGVSCNHWSAVYRKRIMYKRLSKLCITSGKIETMACLRMRSVSVSTLSEIRRPFCPDTMSITDVNNWSVVLGMKSGGCIRDSVSHVDCIRSRGQTAYGLSISTRSLNVPVPSLLV